MADQWHAVYRAADGELVSVGTVLPAALPAGLASVALARAPDWSRDSWDPETQTLTARTANGPPRDRIADAKADIQGSLMLATLTLAQRDELDAILVARFGDVKAD